MLPLELLKVIFGALSRDDLDALMLTNALFHDIVLRDFAKEPLRYFAKLAIAEYESYEFVLTTGHQYSCKDNDDFSRRMRFARVRGLRFNDELSEELFDILLPHKDSWRDGCVITPCTFDMLSLIDRAFSELLFCWRMRFHVYDNFKQPFLSLRAVRECTSLDLLCIPCPLSASEIRDWLKVDARSKEPKLMRVNDYDLSSGVDNLVQQLKTDFADAKTARRYVVMVVTDAYDGQLGRYFNRDTSEELTVLHGTDDNGIRCLEVERTWSE